MSVSKSMWLFIATIAVSVVGETLVQHGPSWMECEGQGFDPRWLELKVALQETRFAKFTNEQMHLPDNEQIYFGRVIEPNLVGLAQEMFGQNFETALAFMRHIESFDWGNLDGINERQGQADWHTFMAAVGIGPSVPSPGEEWFCPFGFVNAASIVARYLHHSQNQEDHWLASQQYHMIQSVLGWSHEMNFLSSSSWPVSTKEINHAHQLITSGHANYHHASESSYTHDFCNAFTPRQVTPVSTNTDVSFQIGAFGHHVPLMLEPASMLLATLHNDVRPNIIFRGGYYACYITPELCDSQKGSAITELLKSWTTTISQTTEVQKFDDVFTGMQTLMKEDDKFMSSDFFICTALVAPCLVLYMALSADKNLLLYQSTELLLAVPEGRKANVLHDLKVLLSDDKSAFVYNSCLWSGRTLYQTGDSIEVLPSISWYGHLGGNVQYRPSSGVLIFRSPILEKTSHGNAFWTALKHFRGKTLRYNFEAMACPPYSEEVGICKSKGKLSYQEMASHTAVVMFPHDFTLMSFGELYAMHIPIFLPVKQWTVQNLGAVFMKHGSLCKDTNGTHVDAEHIQQSFPFSTHWDQANPIDGLDVSLLKLSYWYEYSEFARYPHVLYFKSLPDLISQLHNDGVGIDTSWISRRMKWYHDQQAMAAMSAYGEMLTYFGKPIAVNSGATTADFLLDRRAKALDLLSGFVNHTKFSCL